MRRRAIGALLPCMAVAVASSCASTDRSASSSVEPPSSRAAPFQSEIGGSLPDGAGSSGCSEVEAYYQLGTGAWQRGAIDAASGSFRSLAPLPMPPSISSVSDLRVSSVGDLAVAARGSSGRVHLVRAAGGDGEWLQIPGALTATPAVWTGPREFAVRREPNAIALMSVGDGVLEPRGTVPLSLRECSVFDWDARRNAIVCPDLSVIRWFNLRGETVREVSTTSGTMALGAVSANATGSTLVHEEHASARAGWTESRLRVVSEQASGNVLPERLALGGVAWVDAETVVAGVASLVRSDGGWVAEAPDGMPSLVFSLELLHLEEGATHRSILLEDAWRPHVGGCI